MPAISQNLSIQDLRVIIHGLRMSGFSFVEPEAVSQINFRIKNLPPPEELEGYVDDPASLKRIATEVGEIMHLLEIYGKKGREYKDRFESLKKLPPRYKVVEWRKPKNKAANMDTNFVRQLVRLSARVEYKGHPDISSKIIVCAKKVLNGTPDDAYFSEVCADLKKVKMDKEASIVQEAGIGGFFGGLGGGIGKAFQNVWQSGKAGGLEQDFKNIAGSIGNLLKKINKLVNDAKSSGNQKLEERMRYLSSIIYNGGTAWNKTIDDAQAAATSNAPAPAAPAPAAPAPAPAATPAAPGAKSTLLPGKSTTPTAPTAAPSAVPNTPIQPPTGSPPPPKAPNTISRLLGIIKNLRDNRGASNTIRVKKIANKYEPSEYVGMVPPPNHGDQPKTTSPKQPTEEELWTEYIQKNRDNNEIINAVEAYLNQQLKAITSQPGVPSINTPTATDAVGATDSVPDAGTPTGIPTTPLANIAQPTPTILSQYPPNSPIKWKNNDGRILEGTVIGPSADPKRIQVKTQKGTITTPLITNIVKQSPLVNQPIPKAASVQRKFKRIA